MVKRAIRPLEKQLPRNSLVLICAKSPRGDLFVKERKLTLDIRRLKGVRLLLELATFRNFIEAGMGLLESSSFVLTPSIGELPIKDGVIE